MSDSRSEHIIPESSRQDLEARAGVYELLSRLWLYEVDPELLSELTDGSLAAAWRELGGPDTGDRHVESLATEYCRLFVGPRGHVAPFQSVWESGQHGGTSVSSMREYLSLLNEPVPGLEEIPDHFGVQLLLMGTFLRCLSAESCPTELSRLACDFYQEHVQWAGGLLEAALERTTDPFYCFLITATREFLVTESRIMI